MTPDRAEIRAAGKGRVRRAIGVGAGAAFIGGGVIAISAICGSGEGENTPKPEILTPTPATRTETLPSLTATIEDFTQSPQTNTPEPIETPDLLAERFRQVIGEIGAARKIDDRDYWEFLGNEQKEFRPKVEVISDYERGYLYVIDNNFGVFLEKVDRQTGEVVEEVRDGSRLFGAVFENGVVGEDDAQRFLAMILAQDLNKATGDDQTILGVIGDLDTSTHRVSVVSRDFEHCGPVDGNYLEFTAVIGQGEEGIGLAQQRQISVDDGVCNLEDER